MQLGVAALQSTDIMRVAPPVLLDLLESTREAVNLAVFDTDSMVLIYREQGPQSVTISSRLGTRRSMHASGLGKAYLAALRANERHALIERLELERYTPETIVDKAALERALVGIQKRGYADDCREFEQTLACCAAAVFDHRAVPVAAISVSGPRRADSRKIRPHRRRSDARRARHFRTFGLHPAARGILTGVSPHMLSSCTGTYVPTNEITLCWHPMD